jgi:GxxExxY protein
MIDSRHLTEQIIGAAIKVHSRLGPGLLESAYEACLAYELTKIGLRVERQKPVPVIYDSVKLDCGFRADLVVESWVALELKCKEALHPVDQAQLLSHLRLLNLPIGLLINFHVVLLKDGIKRMVNNYQETPSVLLPLQKPLIAENAENIRRVR